MIILHSWRQFGTSLSALYRELESLLQENRFLLLSENSESKHNELVSISSSLNMFLIQFRSTCSNPIFSKDYTEISRMRTDLITMRRNMVGIVFLQEKSAQICQEFIKFCSSALRTFKSYKVDRENYLKGFRGHLQISWILRMATNVFRFN